MKFISKLAFGLLCLIGGSALAQDTLPQQSSFHLKKRMKVDGIVATVGEHLILESDIDLAFLEIESGGGDTSQFNRCQLLGKLMEDKMYAHHAVVDSLTVSDAEVRDRMDKQIEYMVQQLGDINKVVSYFKKESVEDFRNDLFDNLKTNMLVGKMTDKITSEIEITPDEVRSFFNSLKPEELPQFGAEVEVAQILIEPKISEEEKQRAIDRLLQIKREVEEGASFFGKAVLYTDDKASSSTGGYYRINRKTQFVKEFKDVAFSLEQGEISEPFETEFGYHIIYLEKILGQERELRHILIMPKVTDAALREAREEAVRIKDKIDAGEITFEEAARLYSADKETRNNGGELINPRSMDTHFELTKMDPQLYRNISNLREKEISNPILDQDQTGKKSYKIYRVNARHDAHTADFTRDYVKIKELALKEKQFEAITKWFESKIGDTHIKIGPDYQNCDFVHNWLKK